MYKYFYKINDKSVRRYYFLTSVEDGVHRSFRGDIPEDVWYYENGEPSPDLQHLNELDW